MSLPVSPSELVQVERPAQYLGGEVNSVTKDDQSVAVHLALCFPDTYEVGMSHLGIQLLYEIANSKPWIWAERAYMPLPDMAALLKQKSERLFSLEAKRPLSDFHLVGFSLQYELCATNVLAMLELGGIEILAKDRPDSAPLIIGGGPWSFHPEPLADFFDAFFIGDAEESIIEICEVVKLVRETGWSRARALEKLRPIDGVYLPADFSANYDAEGRVERINAHGGRDSISRRALPTMAGVPFAERPLIPNIKTVHNRLSVEVMRGCVRGCRFCQAGYLYRPQRERRPDEIVDMIKAALPNSGFEEVSLLSLSTADYCSIVPLLKSVMDGFADNDRIAVSFPSTRVDALTPEVLEQVQRVRRTGFTIAPEGGSQRLRDVINKGVSDEQILETVSRVFRMGWRDIKLYFMLGLPTETDDDLHGIIELASRLRKLPEARGKEIVVSVSTFIPKPHTPFQWAEQISVEETVRRQNLLRAGLKPLRVTFRCHDPESSFLEGVLARGDRRLGAVILNAYKRGAELDAWQDRLQLPVWREAFTECGIDPHFYHRERRVDEPLPWDHLSCGIPKSYFAREYSRALRARVTHDCLTRSCSVCEVCDYKDVLNVLWPRQMGEEILSSHPIPKTKPERPATEQRYAVRVQFEKTGPYAFVGHLDLALGFQRAARRANLPLSFSRGFHPMPRISFGPPLQLGILSRSEFADFELDQPVSLEDFAALLNWHLPEGLRVVGAAEKLAGTKSLTATVTGFTFEVEPADGIPESLWEKAVARAMNGVLAEAVSVDRPNRGKKVEGTLQDFVREVSSVAKGAGVSPVEFQLKFAPSEPGIKPLEAASVITAMRPSELRVTKTGTMFVAAGS